MATSKRFFLLLQYLGGKLILSLRAGGRRSPAASNNNRSCHVPRGTIATVFATVVAGAFPAHAETPIAEIIEEAGLSEGPVAMRNRPGCVRPRRSSSALNTAVSPSSVCARPFPNSRSSAQTTVQAAAGAVRDADALIGFCDPELVQRAERLLWIQIFSAGAEDCLAVDAVANGEVPPYEHAEDVLSGHRRTCDRDDDEPCARPDPLRQSHADGRIGTT